MSQVMTSIIMSMMFVETHFVKVTLSTFCRLSKLLTDSRDLSLFPNLIKLCSICYFINVAMLFIKFIESFIMNVIIKIAVEFLRSVF